MLTTGITSDNMGTQDEFKVSVWLNSYVWRCANDISALTDALIYNSHRDESQPFPHPIHRDSSKDTGD